MHSVCFLVDKFPTRFQLGEMIKKLRHLSTTFAKKVAALLIQDLEKQIETVLGEPFYTNADRA